MLRRTALLALAVGLSVASAEAAVEIAKFRKIMLED